MTETTIGPATETERLHIGVVTGGDRVHWVGAAATRASLVRVLSGFLRPRSLYQLREDDGRQFRRLLDQDQHERAVDLYFATVGERWDVERLDIVTRTIACGAAEPADHDGAMAAAQVAGDRAASPPTTGRLHPQASDRWQPRQAG